MDRTYLLETHFHTQESSPCGEVPAAEGIRQYQESGYNGVIVTDHFNQDALGEEKPGKWPETAERFLTGFRAAKAAGDRLGIDVCLGMEIRFPGNEDDMLLYGFDEKFIREHPWLYTKDPDLLRSLADEHHLFLAQAHPYRKGCGRVDPKYLDGLEIINGHPNHESHNALAQEWAAAYKLRPLAGSDYHIYGSVSGYGILLERKPGSIQELVTWLLAGEYEVAGKE